MLYRIKDKSGVVIGVHECMTTEIRAYLVSLPRQQAPYSAKAMPAKTRGLREAAQDAIGGWSVLRGFAIGMAFATPAYVYIGLHFWGVFS